MIKSLQQAQHILRTDYHQNTHRMKEIVLITGANGLTAQKLSEKLNKTYSVRFLTRKKKRQNEFEWDLTKGTIDEAALSGVRHIIHLSGANISEKRWTKKRKQEIISSRVDTARLLLDVLKQNNSKIASFISASAVGFYGTATTEKIYTEKDAKGTDFLSDVVFRWEQAADLFLNEGVAERVVKIRSGVVLSEAGGALTKMKLPIQHYAGAALGKGNQYMPWIHIEDICSVYEYSIQNPKLKGVYNAVSPMHITNKEFTKELARALKKPLLFPNIPGGLIKLVFGEASVILLEGSRVSADKIKEEGFRFKYPTLKPALENLLGPV